MRVLVTGSRDWRDAATMRLAMLECDYTARYELHTVPTLVHGAARGADRMAERIATLLGWRIEAHPVTPEQWQASKSAGFQRNQAMVDAGADICLAFIRNHSRGASHCAAAAERAGIPTARYEA